MSKSAICVVPGSLTLLTVSRPAIIFCACAPHAMRTTPLALLRDVVIVALLREVVVVPSLPTFCTADATETPAVPAKRLVTTFSTAAVNFSQPRFACDPALLSARNFLDG